MKKSIFVFAILIILSLTKVSFAATDASNSNLLNDIRNDPKNYISIGGAGTGLTVFISKRSIDVQRYEPPEYIISIQWLTTTFTRRQENGEWKDIVYANLSKTGRYLYNYETKKIYAETYDKEKNKYWQYLDLKLANGSNASLISKEIDAAEFAFYFAYNMSFFDKPVSRRLKQYIEGGKGTFDNRY